jgi:hypothetical protein
MAHDKQLFGIKLKVVLQKQRLGQALNAKEFAVLAGISYSTSREWFHMQNFPALLRKCLRINGAGEGNRTLVSSLENCRSTIELRPPSRRFGVASPKPFGESPNDNARACLVNRGRLNCTREFAAPHRRARH